MSSYDIVTLCIQYMQCVYFWGLFSTLWQIKSKFSDYCRGPGTVFRDTGILGIQGYWPKT